MSGFLCSFPHNFCTRYVTSSETEKISKKMDMGTNGFYGDTFDNGFGVFETTKRRIVPSGHLEEPFAQRLRFANFSISYSPLNSDTLDT